ncbi:PqiB family protein [Orrella marina]|uniref:Paraquat-inducible protein B n=1 Tax=Orrella marina TaxID=2163011 RepID=A0A2R4XF62_9BURK|nr:MlaD family protein [Orrella marina]AWB32444.1 paraquat-inducible protein B [Orrella marina]
MQPTQPDPKKELPAPRVIRKRRRSQGWVWLIPIAAAFIGLSIIWHEMSNRGPRITITFQSASGLEEGKTQIRYRDVVVGVVDDIRLSENRDQVLVRAQLDKDAAGLANEGTVFWVVRPSIGLEGVSGLATLLSGSYIEADTDSAFLDDPNKFSFVGLEKPPPIKSDRPGTTYRLRADSLGSLGAGTPIYFLRIPVGIVTGYELDEGGQFVDINVFIDAPYDKYVSGSTRFWNESGIYFNINAEGLTVRTESLASIISGGLAFANFGPAKSLGEKDVFKLYTDRSQAEQVPTGVAIPIAMYFEQSTRGLDVGASIEFQGLKLGMVESVELRFDRLRMRMYTKVLGTLYPSRLGPAFERMAERSRDLKDIAANMVDFVERGLRAQLKSSNILSGSAFVELGYHDTPLKDKDIKADLPFVIPTVPSESLQDLQKQITSIVDQLEKIPFESIGTNLDESLKEITQMVRNMDSSVTPELTRSLVALRKTLDELDGLLAASGSIPGQVDSSLREIDRTIRSTRALIDELRARPNSIIFGTPGQDYSRDTLGDNQP